MSLTSVLTDEAIFLFLNPETPGFGMLNPTILGLARITGFEIATPTFTKQPPRNNNNQLRTECCNNNNNDRLTAFDPGQPG